MKAAAVEEDDSEEESEEEDSDDEEDEAPKQVGSFIPTLEGLQNRVYYLCLHTISSIAPGCVFVCCYVNRPQP